MYFCAFLIYKFCHVFLNDDESKVDQPVNQSKQAVLWSLEAQNMQIAVFDLLDCP